MLCTFPQLNSRVSPAVTVGRENQRAGQQGRIGAGPGAARPPD